MNSSAYRYPAAVHGWQNKVEQQNVTSTALAYSTAVRAERSRNIGIAEGPGVMRNAKNSK
jgi:hypothetical protein